MKPQYRKLLAFMSFIDKFHPDIKATFLALYIPFGDDLFFLFHTLRGKRIAFPERRVYKKSARVIKENQIVAVDSTQTLYNEHKEVLKLETLSKGAPVTYQEQEYVLATGVVKLCSVYFALLKKS